MHVSTNISRVFFVKLHRDPHRQKGKPINPMTPKSPVVNDVLLGFFQYGGFPKIGGKPQNGW